MGWCTEGQAALGKAFVFTQARNEFGHSVCNLGYVVVLKAGEIKVEQLVWRKCIGRVSRHWLKTLRVFANPEIEIAIHYHVGAEEGYNLACHSTSLITAIFAG